MPDREPPRPAHPQTLPLIIPANLLAEMIAHCRGEAPLEACGLLTGTGRRASTFEPIRNALVSPNRYQSDQRDMIRAVVGMRARGEEIVAIVHSHPKSRPIPSRTDLEWNYYGDTPQVIISLRGEPSEVRVWQFHGPSYASLAWIIMSPAVESDTASD
jgi:proteasome lid subunit RPN8/RPN11